MRLPKQCACQNGGKCQVDGTCNCGDLEGEFCQKASTVSRQVIGQLGNGSLFALILMLAFLLCLGVIAVLAMTMYKRKMLLFKKNEAEGGGFGNSVVSFHGNVISFSNPTLDDTKTEPMECNVAQLKQQQQQQSSSASSSKTNTLTTTFSNPVYELNELSETDDLASGINKSHRTSIASMATAFSQASTTRADTSTGAKPDPLHATANIIATEPATITGHPHYKKSL